MEEKLPAAADTPNRRFACVCGGSELNPNPPAEENKPPEGDGADQEKPPGDETDSDDGPGGSGSSESSGRGVLRAVASLGRLLLNPFGGALPSRRGQDNVRRRRRRDPKARGLWLSAPADKQGLRRDAQLLIPGLCGLNNMGNTCFMNAAIQCLVHTPLLAAYMISGRYREDVNRSNRLGYGGAVAEEVARLMYQMWLGKYRSISPQSLKRCINATKPMFSGHEQQDSQEFLVELLDALHEDLNVNAGSAPELADKGGSAEPPAEDGRRKRTYSALGPSLEDDVATSLSTSELATYFWDRHRSRNSSVITRLVQGQLRSEVQCPVCKYSSRTFDPFSCISVPLPKDQAERVIPLVAFRRLPWLFKSTTEYHRMLSTGEISLDELVNSYVAMHRNRRAARRCTLTLSRLHEVRDLKTSLARYLVGCAVQFNSHQHSPESVSESLVDCHGEDDTGTISNKQLVLFEFKNKKLTKFLDDRSPLGVVDVIGPTQDPCSSGCYAYESGTDLEFVMSAPVEQFGRPYRSQEDDPSNGTMWESESSTALVRSEEGDASMAERLTKLWFEPTDRVEYATHKSLSVYKTDVVVDLPDISSDPVMAPWRSELAGKSYTAAAGLAAWPKDFLTLLRLVRDCPPFSFRLDAFRTKQAWCSGSMISCDLGSLYGAEYGRSASMGAAEPSLRIHFDGHSSLSDETFTERDFAKGRLAPLYSQTKRLLTLFEVRVTMRRFVEDPLKTPESAASSHDVAGERKRKDNSHLPVSSAIDEILGRNSSLNSPNAPPPAVSRSHDATNECNHDAPPEMGSLGTSGARRLRARVEPIPLGEVFVCQLESFKSCESAFRYIVEQVASRYLTDTELADFIRAGLTDKGDGTDPWDSLEVWKKLPFDVRLVSPGTGPAEVSDFELGYGSDVASDVWENTLFPRDKLRPLSNLYHNNFAVAVDWKSSRAGNKSSRDDRESHIERQLEFLNDGGFEKLISRHRSLMVQSSSDFSRAGAVSPLPGELCGGVTLLDCLRAYSSDEVFEDGTWYCSPCKVHRPGVMRAWFYRLPDVLIIHIKRFNMTARWREKIRTKVVFPLEGLDMTEFMAEKAAVYGTDKVPDEQTESGSNNNIYDLYSVVNHMGGMGGGHYTAAVRYYGHPMEPSTTSLGTVDMTTLPVVPDNDKSNVPPAAEGEESLDPASINITISTDRTVGTTACHVKGATAPGEGKGTGSFKNSKPKSRSRRPFSSLIRDALGCSSVSGVSLEKSLEMLDSLSSEQQAGMPSCVGQWYLLDDEACIPIPEDKVVSANAYVLFYRRRSLTVEHENGHMT